MFGEQGASPIRAGAVVGLGAPERVQRGEAARVIASIRARQIAAVLLEILPAMHPGEAYAGYAQLVADAVLVSEPPHVFENRKFVAARIEELDRGERRAVLVAARIAEEELHVGVREKREVVVLGCVLGI